MFGQHYIMHGYGKRMMAVCLILLTSLDISHYYLGRGRASAMFSGRGRGLGDKRFRLKMPPAGPAILPEMKKNTRWADILQQALQLALDHCKSVRTCNSTSRDIHFDSTCSDCHPCTCDSRCYLRGDCCVDKLLRDLGNQTVLDSVPLTEPVWSCHRSSITTPKPADYVFMVDKCNARLQDFETSSKCFNSSVNVIEGQWPVWSPATLTVYRNADCALCNGEDRDQLVEWNLKIECKKSLHLKDTSNDRLVIEQGLEEPSCHMIFVPPEDCSPVACRLSRGQYIDACNVTGRRLTSDVALWKACEVFQGKMTLENTFKNVFCAMCNEEQLIALGACEEEETFPFVLILNATSLHHPARSWSAKAERCTCQNDEIYDRYEMKCRKLYCSMTRTLYAGQCHPLLTNSTGLSYEISISLTPLDNQQTLSLQNKTSLIQVARNIRTAFLLQGSTASGWDVQINHFRVIVQAQLHENVSLSHGIPNITCFKVHIKFASSWTEPTEMLQTRLYGLMNSIWNVSVDGKPMISFKAAPLFLKSNFQNDSSFFSSVGIYYSEHRNVEYAVDIPDHEIQGFESPFVESTFYLKVSEILKCAKVLFNVSEPALQVNKTSGSVLHSPSGKLISFEFVDLQEDGCVLVCADQLYDVQDLSVIHHLGPSLVPNKPFSARLVNVSLGCQIVALISLCLVFFTYSSFRELHIDVAGKNTLGLVSALLLTLVFLEVGIFSTEQQVLCMVLGMATHFFLLSAFTWVTICIIHLYRLDRRFQFTQPSPEESHDNSKLYLKYVAMASAIPAFIVGVTALSHYLLTEQNNCSLILGYGQEICFLRSRWGIILAVILPVCLVLPITALVLYFSARHNQPGDTAERKKYTSEHHHRQFITYVRISLLLGVIWLMGMMAILTDTEILWYIFFGLCSLLGIYFLLVFTYKKPVLLLYRRWFSWCCRKKKRYTNNQKFIQVKT